MKKLINYLTGAIKNEKYILIFIIIIFLVGLIVGSLFVNFITISDRKLLLEQVNNYFNNVKDLSKDVFGLSFFKSEFLSNLIRLFVIFILGLSIVGVVVVIFLMFYKGFMLGVTLSSIILKYKIKGVMASLLYIFPMQILNIIIYVFLSFFAVSTSLKFIKALLKKDNLNFKTFLGKYLLSFMISIFLITIISFLDSYFTPYMLKIFTIISK